MVLQLGLISLLTATVVAAISVIERDMRYIISYYIKLTKAIYSIQEMTGELRVLFFFFLFLEIVSAGTILVFLYFFILDTRNILVVSDILFLPLKFCA